MKRLQELANEYLKGERDARSFRSGLLAVLSMFSDEDTKTLATFLHERTPQ